ncbi:putative MFS family arabinose efflux permease [Pseudomonas synxantha]|uniref:MFS family arabinose efflux permease n=1 Tax=Pseudomonas synxantha TaxID=47883 RepID=A0ACC6JLB6_9PSED|nr:putative MFS family arabinose efflux permease [Pseudomonas synxantha]
MVAVIQLAITLGATVGRLLYDGIDYQATFIVSGVFPLVAAVLALLVSRMDIPQSR